MLSLGVTRYVPNSQAVLTHRVLVVEDETDIRDEIVLTLKEEGYEVVTAHDGQAALSLLQTKDTAGESLPFSLLILDSTLPKVNGLDVCRNLRAYGNNIPIFMLSAKASETDLVLGLEVGADDYLAKPLNLRVFVARCRALMRRQRLTQAQPNDVKKFGDITLFPQECRVMVRDGEVSLSPKEFRLLELFIGTPRRVWSRDQLIEKIWGPDFFGDTKTVDVHIRWLREKLEKDPSQPEYLITVRGFGYRFG